MRGACFLAVLAAGPCGAVAGYDSPDYPPVSVRVETQQVSEHVYYVPGMPGIATDFEGFVSNAAFVVTPEGVVVFDALGSRRWPGSCASGSARSLIAR